MQIGQVLRCSSLYVARHVWTPAGLIIQLLQGGTFLYVATVLQSVSDHSGSENASEIHKVMRVTFIIFGMLVPFTLSSLLGHGH